MEQVGRDKIETLLATYQSNVPPPQIGGAVQLSEFTNEYHEYKVLEVMTTPQKADDVIEDVSDYADIRVLVRKLKDPLEENDG